MPVNRIRGSSITVLSGMKAIKKPIGKQKPISADTQESEKFLERLYRAPRKPAIRPLPIQESLDRIRDAAKRRAEHFKIYQQSGEEDMQAYFSFLAENEQIDLAREHVRFFINYMIQLAGPGVTERSIGLSFSARTNSSIMKKWREERIASGMPPLKPFTESYYNYYGYED